MKNKQSKTKLASLGLDFGTESVRALIVRLDGKELGCGVSKYKHGQITKSLPGLDKPLPPDYALQHPDDWVQSAAKAVKSALREASLAPENIIGIGVDFTSCTMLPTRDDGQPLCLQPRFAKHPMAWPKLWKHHGAHKQTQRINRVAADRGEAFLASYGGIIGLEWMFPKILETLEKSPRVYQAADVWLEAGDWFVWYMTGASADSLPRSNCQAGYKAMWSAESGYPSQAFLAAVHPDLADVEQKMPGRHVAPGDPAGALCALAAKKLGLAEGTPVSAAIIDAHAGVPGAGAAEEGTLVMVMGTSSCHMLNSRRRVDIPGVAGVVKDGILPGFYGYETGQAAVGDAFDWCRQLLGYRDFSKLSQLAEEVPAGSEGVLCLDWMNGCRTPLMDGSLSGAFTGLKLHHTAGHMYRALMESSAFGFRWIVELFETNGIPIQRLLATGGLPNHNPGLMQIYADVVDRPIEVSSTEQGPAVGAAILGALAAGADRSGFQDTTEAIRRMTKSSNKTYAPRKKNRAAYDQAYAAYRGLVTQFVAATTE